MYLVTGGAGFIGSHLVERLLLQGAQVRVFDNLSTGKMENLAFPSEKRTNLEVFEGDLRDPVACKEACQGVEVVFHLAAVGSVARSVEDPITTSEVNIQGTLQVLLAARDAGARRLVFASSAAVYGSGATPPYREEASPVPLSPYAVSKLTGEHFCGVFSRLYGLETVCLRFFNVFGPRQPLSSRYASLVPRFTVQALRGELPLPVYGDGQQSRDFVYVANVVEANLLAAQATVEGGTVVNIGTGRPYTVLEMIGLMGKLLQKELPWERQPARPGEVRHSYADISRASRVLGYQPRVDVEEGLRRTQAYFKSALSLPGPIQ